MSLRPAGVEDVQAVFYATSATGVLTTTKTDFNLNPPTASAWTISRRDGFEFQGLIDEVRFSDTALDPSQFLNGLPVPEPSTFLLLGTGLIGLAAYRRRKQNA